MCGIAGWITKAGVAPPPETLLQMTNVMRHRGPDDAGHYHTQTRNQEYRIALGHRRLAIIDLAGGHQPMLDDTGSVCVIFNGEIYNFKDLRRELVTAGFQFRTQSDTETILYAYRFWGDDFVHHLRGMFAIALWDAQRERLYMCRDPFEKKPLYVYQEGGRLIFASEIKAILEVAAVPRDIDLQAVWEYLAYRYVPGPSTLFCGIRKLLPGSFVVWEHGAWVETRYYRPPDGEPRQEGAQTQSPIETFRAKLEESVRLRMVSDVPFGAFLSGGLDSSAVVGLMSRYTALPVNTFAVGFPEQPSSELPYATTIARHFGTNHHELVITPDHLMDELEGLIRFRDAPVSEPSDIPIYLLSREAAKSVKMVLTGEGSDEILGGYPKHIAERCVPVYQSLVPGFLRHNLLEPLINSLPFRYARAKTAMVNLGLEDGVDRLPRWFGALSTAERQAFVAFSWPASNRIPEWASATGNSLLRRILFFDQVSWLPDNLLERGDRMTMAASLEARMPFVDNELAAFLSSLPDSWRVRGWQTKRILRRAMQGLLPPQILKRPKCGFHVPVDMWFKGRMRDYLYDHLTGPSAVTRDYYRPEMLHRILRDHTAGRHNYEKLLWTVLNLELFCRLYFKADPGKESSTAYLVSESPS